MDDPLATPQPSKRGSRTLQLVVLFSASLLCGFLYRRSTDGFPADKALALGQLIGAAFFPFVLSLVSLRFRARATLKGLMIVAAVSVIAFLGRSNRLKSEISSSSPQAATDARPAPSAGTQPQGGVAPVTAPGASVRRISWPEGGHEFQVSFPSPPTSRQATVDAEGRSVLVQVAELKRDDLNLQAQIFPLQDGNVVNRSFAESQVAKWARDRGFDRYGYSYDDSNPGFPVATFKASREVSPAANTKVTLTFHVDFHFGVNELFLAIVICPASTYPSPDAGEFLKSVQRTK